MSARVFIKGCIQEKIKSALFVPPKGRERLFEPYQNKKDDYSLTLFSNAVIHTKRKQKPVNNCHEVYIKKLVKQLLSYLDFAQSMIILLKN